MPNRLKNLGTMLSDGRTRTVLVFTVILLAVGVVFGFLKLHRSGAAPGSPGGSTVTGAPQNIQSIPGGFGTPESAEYARLQAQQNVNEAKRAAKTGGSAIPTLISSSALGQQGFASSQGGGASGGKEASEPQGCVAPGTNLYNAACQVVGTLGPDGFVRPLAGVQQQQENQNVLGKLVYGPNGQVIGRVGPDGEVLNAQGQIIGRVGPDGEVLNAQGQVIGKVAPAAAVGAPVYGPNGQLLGHINANGDVVNAQGQVIGHILPNGQVVNAQGQVIGQAASFTPGRLVYGPNGQVLGRVEPNGDVVNAQGQVIGHVGPNGEVLNAQGRVIGRVSTVAPGQLVYGPNGQVIGRVLPNGQVVNAQGQVIGHVNANGEVVGPNGQVIGEVRAAGGKLRPGTVVYDGYGNAVGTIGPGGRLIPATQPGARGARVAAATTAAGAGGAATGAGAGMGSLPTGVGGENAQLQALLARQAAQLNATETQQMKQQIQSGMSSQANQLLAAWAPPGQQYVAGSAAETGGAASAGSGAGGGQAAQSAFEVGAGPVVKAGSIMFAVLDTSVSTDEPGPILATISSGSLKGGKLIGTLTNQGQKILITFNTLSYNNFPTSIGIHAVAIDPSTARTGLSDYTNNHYLLRYGTLFAASFMQGYAQAISQSGSTIVSNGFNTQKNMPSLSPSGEMVVALGNVGAQYSSVLSSFQNIPPTVHVYSGTGVGVLILSDLRLPMPVA